MIDDNYKFSVLILVIAGFALGLVAIASVRVVRKFLAAQPRAATSADGTEIDTHAETTSWSVVAARTGAALIAVGAAAAFLLSGLAEHFVEEKAQQLPKLRAIVLVIAFVSALIPALRPRLSSLALGVLLGLLTAAAIGVVTVFAMGAVNSLPAAVMVLTITAAPVAGGAAVIALAVSFVTGQIANLGVLPRLARFGLGCTFVAASVYAGHVWYHQPPALDPGFRLQPSTWHGEMTYGYRAYAFKLVIEKVDGTGQFVASWTGIRSTASRSKAKLPRTISYSKIQSFCAAGSRPVSSIARTYGSPAIKCAAPIRTDARGWRRRW